MPYKVQCRTYKFVLTHMNLCYLIQPGYRIKAAHFSIIQNTNKISVCMVNSTAYQNHNLTEETNSSSSIAKCQSALDDPESSINAGYDVKRVGTSIESRIKISGRFAMVACSANVALLRLRVWQLYHAIFFGIPCGQIRSQVSGHG